MRKKVFLIDQPEYDTPSIRAKVRAGFEQSGFNPNNRSVFVKPSFVYPARAPRNLAVITQPQLIAGVAGALRDLGARRVMVAEDSLLGPSEVAFTATGVLPHLCNLAEPLYLKNAKRVKVAVPKPRVEAEFLVPKSWLDADLFVSLPKIKVNLYAQVTLSVKNNLGLLLQADRLRNHHYDLQKKIADLYQVRPPDFVVADAIVAGEGQGPMAAEPVHFGLLLAGCNGPAVDAVACRLMGFDPLEIEHLRYVAEDGLGPIRLEEIEIDNRPLLEQRRRQVRRPRLDFGDFPASIHFHVGTELACGPGCVGMIRNTLDPWLKQGRLGRLHGFHFIVGKPVDNLPDDLPARRTIVFGDCALPHRERGTFLPGCPVTPLALTFALAAKGKPAPLETRIWDIGRGYLKHWLSRSEESPE